MGNASSSAAATAQQQGDRDGGLGGVAAAGAAAPRLEMVQGSTKSWATMDHTLSGPWSFLVKEEVQCLCEGGRNCAHENPARQQERSPIAGLHSSWVGDQVLAMARPWQENVMKHDVVAQFKQHNIGMILNLQEVGEHESCGPGNLASSGFTYNPETFMAAKVGVYNISWRDMGVPTLEKMMDIVQIMQYTTLVECRRVAVHCHAGLGRTGLAVACFLLASGQACSAARAVEMVRAARPGSLQTQAQVMFVSIFEQYLLHLRCLFKVADLKHLSLGNTNYIVTKVCRRISRSMSGQHQAGSAGATPDALAAAAAAVLGPLAFASPAGSGGSSLGGSVPGSATAAAAAAAAQQGLQPDWASATYEVLPPAAAAAAVQQLQRQPSAAEAAANAALNLGPAGVASAAATPGGQQADSQQLVMTHARRLSGGGSMKLVSNLRAIEEEGLDKPVHIIQTDNAVTEVYGHGLTIIRATDSVKKMYAHAQPASSKSRASMEQRPTEQQQPQQPQLPTPHELGLDKQLPWNDRFAIRPEAFRAEGWLPEPPSSYLEALRRQQRLLHGNERRRCLHQHKLLRAAAKALAAAAEAYKAVPVHTDASHVELSAAGVASPSVAFKRTHTRSRSNAAAIDLLAVAGGLSPSGSGIPQQAQPQQQPHDSLRRSPSNGSSMQALTVGVPAAAGGCAGGVAAGNPGGSGLMSKQQQLAAASSGGSPAGAGAAAAAAPHSAAALLPGLHLGPPGTSSSSHTSSHTSSSNNNAGGSSSSPGALVRKLSRQGSSAKKSSSQSPAAAAAAGGFFLPTANTGSDTAAANINSSPAPASSSPAAAAAAGGSSGISQCCTPVLAGCCAPSFAVGLLIALLYKGRVPEEYEAQWAACPRLKALGLDEGHAVCQALQDVKLAVNTGSYEPLESASGAVAVCVLADWFDSFGQEAFSEATLELLVDDAETLLAEALAAAATSRAQQQQQEQEQRGGGGGRVGNSSGQQQHEDEAGPLARRAAARSVCTALAPYEQDLCLLLAAVLRHARHASLEDPRLQEHGLAYSNSGSSTNCAAGTAAPAPAASSLFGANTSSSGSTSGNSGSTSAQAAAVLVEGQVDAAMAVLYRLMAGWLLGPLALACVPALEGVAAFLHYLTVDDTAYGCLLQTIQQGVRRARSAPAVNKSKSGALLWESLDSAGTLADTASGSAAQASPRAQQQQNMDRLEKLKLRLLGAGSSFRLVVKAPPAGAGGSGGSSPSSPRKQALAALAAAQQQQPSSPGLIKAAAGQAAGPAPSPPAAAAGVATAAAAAAAQHSIGKSKLRHASSSPELCKSNSAEQQHSGSGSGAKHPRSKLGAPAAGSAAVSAPAATAASPEPKGCASLTQMLSQKLHSSLSGNKHQQPPLPRVLTPDQPTDGAPPATLLLVPHPPPTHRQPQPEPSQQQQQVTSPTAPSRLSPQPSGSSCAGDSISEVIQAGNAGHSELCVGRMMMMLHPHDASGSESGAQGCAAAAGRCMEDELAALPGSGRQQQKGEQEESKDGRATVGSSLEGHPGVLDSPPRSVSPEAPSLPSAAAARHAGRGSGNAAKQHPVHHPHMRLPPVQRCSFEAAAAGSDGGSSFTGSPCSSMGSITGMLMAAQLHQTFQLQHLAQQQQQPAGCGGDTDASAPDSGGDVAGAGVGVDLSGLSGLSQPVSVSALSELSLQSSHSASRVVPAAGRGGGGGGSRK